MLKQNINPFNSVDSNELYNIASGRAALQEVCDFSLSVENKGQELKVGYRHATEHRLVTPSLNRSGRHSAIAYHGNNVTSQPPISCRSFAVASKKCGTCRYV